MTPADYERFRQQLEAQLRSDVEVIYQAYCTKLRAYETVLRAQGELEGIAWEPPAALALPAAGLPALPGAAERALPPAAAVPPPQARMRRKIGLMGCYGREVTHKKRRLKHNERPVAHKTGPLGYYVGDLEQ